MERPLKFKRIKIISLVWLFPLTVFAWKDLQEGFQYQQISGTHLFRIDPKKYRSDLLVASDYGSAALPAKNYQAKSGALLVINGGFFDETYHPLGLLVKKGVVLNPLRNTDWGIFQTRPGIPAILHRQEWNGQGVEMAIQVGPRLVINGKVPSFKPEPERHRRSAIGITPDGWILIALSEFPLTIAQWAEQLKKETTSALNLDGGGSSQLTVQLKNFSLEVPGTTNVPNAVAVFEK